MIFKILLKYHKTNASQIWAFWALYLRAIRCEVVGETPTPPITKD